MNKKEKNENIFDYQILRLTNEFYKDYPNPPFQELLKKQKRGYNCLLIQSHYGYFICVPYRSEIKHKYAFLFRNTQRSKKHRSGLDYTKIVIVKDSKYLSDKTTTVDQDEYKATRDNIHKIVDDVLHYVDEYATYMQGKKVISEQEFKRRYEYSTLKYFHKEMEIE